MSLCYTIMQKCVNARKISKKTKNNRNNSICPQDRKHYQIRAVRDGVIITNSDTVDGWNSAGTSAAVVHYGKPHLVYSYVREEDSYYIKEKSPARFVSNETGGLRTL